MIDVAPDWAFDDHDRAAMSRALVEAHLAGAGGDVPVGAVICDETGTIIATAGNRREQDGDPTAHAEILALRAAARVRGGWRLSGCTLYVTLEPCAMCAAAANQARVEAVVFAVADPAAGCAGSLANLADSPRLGHRVAVRAGLFGAEAGRQLAAFFANVRDRG